jgi:hypothetical protein
MKIFKLKYLAIALTLATLGSCASDDALQDGEKTASESNSFEFEEGYNNYVINGKLTYDRKEIASAAKDAYNLHYDGPKNRVVISSTPAEFEKYKNSNPELKAHLLANDEAAKINASKSDQASGSQAQKAFPTGAPAEYVAAFDDANMLVVRGERTFSAAEGAVIRLCYRNLAAAPDLSSIGVRRTTVRTSGGATTETMASTMENISAFTSGSTYSKRRILLHNNSGASLSRTFYSGKNYTGTISKTITAAAGQAALVTGPTSTRNWLSFK